MTTDAIKTALVPLLARRDQVAAERAGLRAEMDVLDEELRAIDKVLRAGGVIEPMTKKAKAKAKPAYASEALVQKARDAVQQLGEDPFTAKMLAPAMGVSDASARNAIVTLRERGELRLVGELVPEGNGSGMKAAHYAAIS